MTIDAAGWFDWMIFDPGPLEKTNGGRNTCKIVVPHSAEGYWSHLQQLLHSLDRQASWMFSNLNDGRCFQHYSIYAQVWGSDSGYPNNNGVMWENEGVAGEPLTDLQVENCVRIIREVSALKGWIPSRPRDDADKDATMYEHRECVRWGSEATACPSDRIPWDRILSELSPEEGETVLLACGDSPSGYRLYQLAVPPVWITNPIQAQVLKDLSGEPKGATWGQLQALGAT